MRRALKWCLSMRSRKIPISCATRRSALQRLIRGLPPLPPTRSKPDVARDDLAAQIRGITASMARRLNALDVTTFTQIADWRAADIQSISADLGIGKQIYAQNWIEQAALLAKPAVETSASDKTVSEKAVSDKSAASVAPSETAFKPDRATPSPAPVRHQQRAIRAARQRARDRNGEVARASQQGGGGAGDRARSAARGDA